MYSGMRMPSRSAQAARFGLPGYSLNLPEPWIILRADESPPTTDTLSRQYYCIPSEHVGQLVFKIKRHFIVNDELCGLHRTYIGSVERSKRNISIDNIENVATALKVSPPELLTAK